MKAKKTTATATATRNPQPATRPAAVKVTLANVTFPAFAAFGEAMAGGFIEYRCTRNKAGVLTSARLSIPRFRGESFAAFVAQFAAGLPEGARLGKAELAFLRSVFAASDDAARAYGGEAARVVLAYGRNGLRIDSTAFRA